MITMRGASRLAKTPSAAQRKICVPYVRTWAYATQSAGFPVVSSGRHHRVLLIGCGSAGMNIAHRLLRTGGFSQDDIGAVDPAEWHHYQPGWTLVGAGLKRKQDLRKPLKGIIDSRIKLHSNQVASFSPAENLVTLENGANLTYDQLVVVAGIGLDLDSMEGLQGALSNAESKVTSIYTYDNCDGIWDNISKFGGGDAIFTQPTGVVKCAGAPQKIMWLALDHWRKNGIYDPSDPSSSRSNISFATGLPAMFAVPKYGKKLDQLREERGVEGLFEHALVSVDGNTATFARPGGEEPVKRKFDFLHVVPKMGPLEFVKSSSLSNEAGFVDVDEATTQHKKYPNVWSCGDASALLTSKTAAAITAQVPILVANLINAMEGKGADSQYDGYTCCPIPTECGKLMLAEFRYGGQPKEAFSRWLGDQATPHRLFYYLKKDFFPGCTTSRW